MKKLNPKEIISKSCKRMLNDFNNFARIALVVFIVTTPFYLFSAYYDEYVLDIYNEKGMIAFIRGSGLTKILNWLVLFPLASAFLANWHRYILFSGKKPWKYFPIDFSKYTFHWIWTAIKVGIVFFVPAVIFVYLSIFLFGINIFVFAAIYVSIVIIYFVRVSLIFPATAAQHDNSFTRAFKMSKNNFWSLFLVYISIIPAVLVWFLLLMLMEFIISSESSIAINLFYHFISYAFAFILYGYLASCLSESYKVLGKK